MGGLTKLYRISEWVTESGRAPASSWWSNGSWNWPQASAGSPAARASALKQWSQLHTLSIQCLDISTAGRVRNPAGRTVADHRTYAASSAAGVSLVRHGVMASAYWANSVAAAAAICPKVWEVRYGGRALSYSSIATSHGSVSSRVTLRSVAPSCPVPAVAGGPDSTVTR